MRTGCARPARRLPMQPHHVLLLIAALVPEACVGAPACVDPGTNRLGIAEARLPKVAGMRVDGACTVESLPASCDPSVVCYEGSNGDTIATVVVTGSKRGS